MGKNGDSGSTSGPQMVPIRSTTGWTPLPRRLCVVSGSTAFLKATIRCGSSAAGSGSSSCQRVSVRPAYTPMLLATANLRTPQVRAASMDDVADVVATGEGEEGVPVGYVEGFHGDPAGEEDGTSVRWCAVTTTSRPRSTSARAVWAP